MSKRILIIQAHPAQDGIGWAEHIVFFFPLWLGDMPASLKGFLEQVARPGFAILREKGGSPWGNKGVSGDMKPEAVARWQSKRKRLGATAG